MIQKAWEVYWAHFQMWGWEESAVVGPRLQGKARPPFLVPHRHRSNSEKVDAKRMDTGGMNTTFIIPYLD